jgi:hypothetical protein
MAFIRDRETGDITDPERNAVLGSKGGTSDGYKFWTLTWNDQIIEFTAKDRKTYGGERGQTPLAQHWMIVSMNIPENLLGRLDEIKELVKASMEATYLYYVPTFEVSVTAEFDHNFIK